MINNLAFSKMLSAATQNGDFNGISGGNGIGGDISWRYWRYGWYDGPVGLGGVGVWEQPECLSRNPCKWQL